MYKDDDTFQKELLAHKVYSAWQFITFTRKNIDVVDYCFMTIKNIINEMKTKPVQCEQVLSFDSTESYTVDGKKESK